MNQQPRLILDRRVLLRCCLVSLGIVSGLAALGSGKNCARFICITAGLALLCTLLTKSRHATKTLVVALLAVVATLVAPIDVAVLPSRPLGVDCVSYSLLDPWNYGQPRARNGYIDEPDFLCGEPYWIIRLKVPFG
jgi:hypothetical protein